MLSEPKSHIRELAQSLDPDDDNDKQQTHSLGQRHISHHGKHISFSFGDGTVSALRCKELVGSKSMVNGNDPGVEMLHYRANLDQHGGSFTPRRSR